MIKALLTIVLSLSASLTFANYCPQQFSTAIKSQNYYIVELGDSLWNITSRAGHINSNWPILARANPQVCNPNLIFPGTLLNLPQGWFIDSSNKIPAKLTVDQLSTEASKKDLSESKIQESTKQSFDELLNNPLTTKAIDELKQIKGGSCEVVFSVNKTLAQIADKNGTKDVFNILKHELGSRNEIESFFACEARYSGEIQLETDIQTDDEIRLEADTQLSQEERRRIITVLFVNGIDNMHFEAERSKKMLKKALREKDQDKVKGIQFGLAYNTTYGVIPDLIEVFIQKNDETDSADNLDADTGLHATVERSSDEIVDKIVQFTAKFLQKFSEDTVPELKETQQKLLDGYRKLIKEQSCGVVVVAHSQGNLFTNWAYQQLDPKTERPHVSVIAVASPAAHTADLQNCSSSNTGFTHFTNSPANNNDKDFKSGDIVIGGLQKLSDVLGGFEAPLCRNIPHPRDEEDWMNHGFTDAYIGPGDPAREPLLTKIFSEVERLRSVASNECNIYTKTLKSDKLINWSLKSNQMILFLISFVVALLIAWRLYQRRKR